MPFGPNRPAGTVRTSFESGMKNPLGRNTSVLDPSNVHLPGTFGDSLGSAVSAASGTENWTLISLENPTAMAPGFGRTANTFSRAGGRVVLGTVVGKVVDVVPELAAARAPTLNAP